MEQTINIEQIFSILRKYRRLILSSTVVCTLLAIIVTFFFITPQYSASTELLVNRKQSTDVGAQLNQVQADVQMINTYKDLITKPVIMDSVASKMNKGMATNLLLVNLLACLVLLIIKIRKSSQSRLSLITPILR